MITLTREEAQQVLDALETLAKYEHPEHKIQIRKQKNGGHIVTVYPHKLATNGAEILSARLSAPERAWQGLTEQEHANIAVEAGCASADWVFYGAAVERALKEKNT
jgi:hypothetical protein